MTIFARLAALAAAAVLSCGGVAQAAGVTVFPVHGTILAVPAPGEVIASVGAVSDLYAAQTRRYHMARRLPAGTTFDAYLNPRTATLDEVNPAAAFVPGLPNHLITRVLAVGDELPDYPFESQTGQLMRLSDLRGKVVLLSFVYTRCPDLQICPAISGKFAYLQHHLDPQHFHLVTITLDPLYDSPAVLAGYGRERFGADPNRWSLLTGEPAQIKNVLDSFGLDPLETNPGHIIHGDTLVILNTSGKIADLVPTAGWAPDDAIATAENIAGLSSNPLRRFELATIAGVIAFCGGSVSTATVILDSSVFILGVGILGGLLMWITKRVIIDERY